MVEVNYENLVTNYKNLQSKSKKKIICVVKEDAYNLGIEKSVENLYQAGCRMFFVADILEAKKIVSEDVQVLVGNPIPFEELKNMSSQIQVTVPNYAYLEENLPLLKEKKIHLKYNSSLNRFGVNSSEELKKMISFCKKNELNLVGIYTHFADSESDLELHEQRIDDFVNIYNDIKDLYAFKYIHAESTASFLLNNPKLDFCTHARIGIGIYGFGPKKYRHCLIPTISVYAKVINLMEVKQGKSIGYTNHYKLAADSIVAVCDMGYGQGLNQVFSHNQVLINGKYYSMVGRISMSHFYVVVDANVKLFDRVDIFNETLRLDDSEDTCNLTLRTTLTNLKINH